MVSCDITAETEIPGQEGGTGVIVRATWRMYRLSIFGHLSGRSWPEICDGKFFKPPEHQFDILLPIDARQPLAVSKVEMHLECQDLQIVRPR